MIIQYGYQANGFKPQQVLGLGFIVRRYGTDASGQSGPLTGKWSNILRLDMANNRRNLETRSERLRLEVHDDLESH